MSIANEVVRRRRPAQLRAAAPVRLEITREQEILELLDAAPKLGETIEHVYRRKEHELRELFAKLSVGEARVLHHRLTVMASDDPIAQRFGRMIATRRQRLIAFLGDARRREALARCGRGVPVEQP